jgi:hypothetical protein
VEKILNRKNVKTRNSVGKASVYCELAQKMLWGLGSLVGLFTYMVEIRPFVNVSFGTYCVGLSDGIFVTILALAIIFYAVSRTRFT